MIHRLARQHDGSTHRFEVSLRRGRREPRRSSNAARAKAPRCATRTVSGAPSKKSGARIPLLAPQDASCGGALCAESVGGREAPGGSRHALTMKRTIAANGDLARCGPGSGEHRPTSPQTSPVRNKVRPGAGPQTPSAARASPGCRSCSPRSSNRRPSARASPAPWGTSGVPAPCGTLKSCDVDGPASNTRNSLTTRGADSQGSDSDEDRRLRRLPEPNAQQSRNLSEPKFGPTSGKLPDVAQSTLRGNHLSATQGGLKLENRGRQS